MRRPHRGLWWWVFGAVLAGAAVWGAWRMGDPASQSAVGLAVQVTLGALGYLALPLCGFFVLFNAIDRARYRRLVSGRDFLARWTVDPQRWCAFLHANEALNAVGGRAVCRIDYARPLAPGGVQVVVGKTSVLIDGDFHRIPREEATTVDGPHWCNGPPAFIEFRLSALEGDTDERTHWCVRIPTAADDDPAAAEAFAFYKAGRANAEPERTPAARR